MNGLEVRAEGRHGAVLWILLFAIDDQSQAKCQYLVGKAADCQCH